MGCKGCYTLGSKVSFTLSHFFIMWLIPFGIVGCMEG